MKLLIIGGGIGGLVTALSLHQAGIEVDIFDQSQELRELGVGINLLPHAVKELAGLGLLPALDEAGIRTRELIYLNRHGQVVWRELRGRDAGYEVPQISIHRGKLHGVLLKAVLTRLGPDRLHTDRRLVDLAEKQGKVTAFLESRSGGRFEASGDGLIGADGIHSRVRAIFYPDEGPLLWSGIMLWRGATNWPIHEDGRTMVIAGGNAAKFVFYPIHFDPARPGERLTNWAIMARIADGAGSRRRAARIGTASGASRRRAPSSRAASAWVSSSPPASSKRPASSMNIPIATAIPSSAGPTGG